MLGGWVGRWVERGEERRRGGEEGEEWKRRGGRGGVEGPRPLNLMGVLINERVETQAA